MNAPKRPDYFPPPVAISPEYRSAVDEGVGHIKKVALGLFDFMTADSDEDFAERLDAKHGTRVASTLRRFTNIEPQPGEAPEAPRPRPVAPPVEPVEGDAEVVVVVDVAPCTFCKGKQVVTLKRRTNIRTPIACPECNNDPRNDPRRRAKALPR